MKEGSSILKRKEETHFHIGLALDKHYLLKQSSDVVDSIFGKASFQSLNILVIFSKQQSIVVKS